MKGIRRMFGHRTARVTALSGPREEIRVGGPFRFDHSLDEELAELARLRDEGIVTEREFEQKKRQFLNR